MSETLNINEGSVGEIYNIVVKNEKTKAIIDLTNYTSVFLILISTNGKTKYDTLTVAFGTKTEGEVVYTTAATDSYPAIPAGRSNLPLIGQLKITGTDLDTLSRSFQIVLDTDYSVLA